ncbi:anti-sigma factor antagonist [Streptomyces spiroverticillatus]|uniref:Anti-sigma factor antagonist n=1 Tax=Streptomyces finlayi TaxID=67296 RepID=A0A918X8J9_9ACTN|nr:STAS domain-containing protein [Streptomyces finlayi]GHA42326.1 anti-sigma factor antagonist [Streptomyces spiroverticillatus]GHD17055.1 anti-sigma factor antagonist [Streptomyces finlayi]
MNSDLSPTHGPSPTHDPAPRHDLSPARKLTVDVRSRDAGVVLAVAGDLDFDNSPRLRTALNRLALDPGDLMVMDLAEVTFFDSSGVTMLIIARKVAQAADAEIVVTGITPMVAKIFRITGLDEVFRTYADPEAAFADSVRN